MQTTRYQHKGLRSHTQTLLVIGLTALFVMAASAQNNVFDPTTMSVEDLIPDWQGPAHPGHHGQRAGGRRAGRPSREPAVSQEERDPARHRHGQPDAAIGPRCECSVMGAGEPTPETHVRCPDCAEWVRKKALVCKHCGRKLIPQ